jgi:serine/threonine protein kinase
MAEILKARDTSQPHAPIVAVKRILPHLTEDRQYVTMFLDESRVLAQLEHDNIIRTLEVGQVGETPFIALEYVFGQDARMLFHRARRGEQRIPIGVACYIIAQACEALHFAHEHTDADGNLLGLVHRDVSLQNILVSYDGAVKLTDFGIAMSAQNVARTEVGIVKGKFGYMSPEQIRGEPMDRRSDVFAAGICLYELLTSERLFSGESDYAAVEKVRNAAIEPPSRWNREIPSALEAIVMKSLAKHPRDRYQSAADLRRALLVFMAESHSECSAKDLAQHMRSVFAEDLAKYPTPEALHSAVKRRNDELTGLAAFDNLDQVSTVSGTSAVHQNPVAGRAPSVPPVVPRRDSIPAGRSESDVFPLPEPLPGPSTPLRVSGAGNGAEHGSTGSSAPGVGLDWDDEELTTGTSRVEEVEPLPQGFEESSEDDVTRQLYVGETFSGVALGVSDVRHKAVSVRPVASPDAAPSPFEGALPSTEPPRADFGPVDRADEPALTPWRPLPPQTSYLTVVAIVVSIIAVIALALYLTRGARPAEIHLATMPTDAMVVVDGKPGPGTRSPFVIGDLSPGARHSLEVSKPGYRSWSSNLSLTSGQVLQLPVVTLVPEPAPLARVAPEPEAPPPAVVPTASSAPSEPPAAEQPPEASVAAPEQGKRKAGGARSKSSAAHAGSAATTAHSTAGHHAPPSGAPSQAAPGAGGGATGVLRINSRPWAELTIDGRRMGNTPQMNLALAAGTHSVHLSNPQLGVQKTIKVRISPGQTLTQIVDLQ